MSAQERAARVVYSALWLMFWLLYGLCVAALLAGCARAQAEPKPDAYLVVTPTSTTLAAPGYVPEPAGPPTEAGR